MKIERKNFLIFFYKNEVRNVNGSDSLLAVFNLANYQNFIYKYQEIFFALY